jgi:hypothetical protein
MGTKQQERAQAAYENIKKGYTKNATDLHAGGWNTWYSLGFAETGTDAGEALAQQYANIMGYKDFDVTNFKGDKIVYKYTDDEGEVKKGREIDYKTMIETVADSNANSEASLQLLADIVNG